MLHDIAPAETPRAEAGAENHIRGAQRSNGMLSSEAAKFLYGATAANFIPSKKVVKVWPAAKPQLAQLLLQLAHLAKPVGRDRDDEGDAFQFLANVVCRRSARLCMRLSTLPGVGVLKGPTCAELEAAGQLALGTAGLVAQAAPDGDDCCFSTGDETELPAAAGAAPVRARVVLVEGEHALVRRVHLGGYERARLADLKAALLVGADTAQHYAALGLSTGASPREVRRSYRRLAKQHHPDKGGDRAAFLHIQQAFEALTLDSQAGSWTTAFSQESAPGTPGTPRSQNAKESAPVTPCTPASPKAKSKATPNRAHFDAPPSPAATEAKDSGIGARVADVTDEGGVDVFQVHACPTDAQPATPLWCLAQDLEGAKPAAAGKRKTSQRPCGSSGPPQKRCRKNRVPTRKPRTKTGAKVAAELAGAKSTAQAAAIQIPQQAPPGVQWLNANEVMQLVWKFAFGSPPAV
eukprot:gnl/TRDRNA2_/TRDRNA2_80194_c0_seq1.p1 gnl/TRDRNA2_/TRDRNA2_80194_c0~~gnl/TRDRNA2_/TRDRNA2_80194_c0_seq1.p1  ORF type:complete len:479 (-),score=85.01 gnl/TRDRNA2_/TRDRNA2_80194_c0_seq1:80-1471(-)